MSLRTARQSAQLALASTVLLATNLAAQQPKVLAPHKPIAPKVAKTVKWLTPSTPRTMVGGLWKIDANYKSSIYLKNIVETDPVTVTPILYLSNGNKYTLPDVTVEPAGVAIISINDALQKKGISSWGTLSGYVEIQYSWPWDPFCASVRSVDTAHSLIFTYYLRPTSPLPLHLVHPVAKTPTHLMEGMWWKQESNVTGFVALANLSAQLAQATVQVTDQLGTPLAEHNVTISPHGMKTVNLRELAALTNTQGGVRIVSSETTDNLVVNGGLEDETVGYSATLPFSADPVEETNPKPINIAELGLMTGAADPMMFFPAGTTFTPYSVLRNVSSTPVLLTPTLWWMEGAAANSAQLPKVSLPPYQTQSLDMKSLLSRYGPKNFNGSFNLVFEGEAKPGALVMSSGSVDQTNNYVFEVVPRGVAEGGGRSLQYWSTGNGDDTMITLWNPADEAQDLVFTLFFTGGHYAVPLHLEPRATRGFNVSEIVQGQVPDAEGNLIPVLVHEGSAKISGSLGENQHILIAVGAGVYNVRKATCGDICNTCDGYTEASALASPFAVGVSKTYSMSLMATYNTGGQYNLAGSATWSSSKTSVATVGKTTGVATGVAPGAATLSATTGQEPIGLGYYCYDPTQGNGDCPEEEFGGDSGGTVAPTISSFDPDPIMIGATNTTLTINGAGFGTAPTVSLPAGITSTGQGSTNTQIILTGANVALSTTVGSNNVKVTADGEPSAPSALTVDGPYHMVVQSDVTGLCSGCKTTPMRTVTYQVQNFSGTPANQTWMGENISVTGWSCTQSNPGFKSAPCSNNFNTNAAGIFSDQWSLGADGYTPTGCGDNVTDHWQWCAHSSAQTLGTLTGYGHTNAVSINGVVSPNGMTPGTVVPF
ncbi:MAG TPA: Ig-like domain-containing protein [Acidobacteriaceae bacterium]|jgi:hypothetical protein|nr:Ig-like domain-containing protein [Acidobacteriaceae bacterium]